MEEESATCAGKNCDLPQPVESQVNENVPNVPTKSEENEQGEPASNNNVILNGNNESLHSKDESGVVLECEEKNLTIEVKESFADHEPCEVNDDARSLGDLDSLPAGDELVLGAAGSDSGVEGCGRALSSGGGSRSCASSVVSCGSGCGSESSSIAGAPPRPRRRVNVTVAEPKRSSPLGSSTPRPVTAPRGPNLATRERARSREKPTLPEKPRPLTPKPRIRPTTDLPNLVRESPALRAKPTKTSSARCRTPNSPSEEKRWPSNGPRLTTVTDASATRVAADKYGTLPRRRKEAENDASPKHESTPPRRPTVTRSVSSRSTTKMRVRIYAEKTSQTVLLGTDVESAFAGVVPNIENHVEVSRCHRGVQASSRDVETARLTAAAAAAEASAAAERERRELAESQLAAERAARLAAIAELERNSQRLLELAGAGAGAGTEGCLRALEEQLRSAGELAARQRTDIDTLRERCDKLYVEARGAKETARSLEARLAEAEREAAEMQDFLAAETAALGDSLREADAEIARLTADLERRRAECRQLVRISEQRRQEALAAAARARSGGGAGGAAHALDALGRRLRALAAAVRAAYSLPRDALQPPVYHNDVYRYCATGGAAHALDALGRRLRALAAAVRAAYSLPRDALQPPVYHNDVYRYCATGGAAHALDALGRRLRALAAAVRAAYSLPRDALQPPVYHNDVYRYCATGGAAHALDALGRRLRALAAAVRAAYSLPRDALQPPVYHNDVYRYCATGGAAHALDALGRRLRALAATVRAAYSLPRDALQPPVYHNDVYSRSDSGEALSPEEEPRGLLAAVARALRSAPPLAPATPGTPAAPACPEDDRSRDDDDNDNSADLLDSETEPCLVTDPECAEEWWSGAEGAAWSGDELSPEREQPDDDKEPESASASERDSLRNLSAAIAARHRSEAEDMDRGGLLTRVLALDTRLSELLRALQHAAAAAARQHDAPGAALAHALTDKIELTERNVADVVVKKLAELDASQHMCEQYRLSVEALKKQLAQAAEEDDLEFIEEELSGCTESERRARYAALDAALSALAGPARAWPRLAALHRALERLAFAAVAAPALPALAHAHAPALPAPASAPAPVHAPVHSAA